MEMHASWAARPSNGSEIHKMTKTIRMARAKLKRKRMPLLIRECIMPVDGKLYWRKLRQRAAAGGEGRCVSRASARENLALAANSVAADGKITENMICSYRFARLP